MRWLYGLGLMAIVGTFIADIWLTVNYEVDADISLIYLAVAVTVFALLYGFRSNWKANAVGKVFAIKCLFLALAVNQVAVSAWFPDYPLRQPIRFILYTAGAWTYAAMVLQLLKSQRRDRQKKKQELQDQNEGDPL